MLLDNWESLQREKKSNDESIRDIWDGAALKPLINHDYYFLTPNHLALSISTDGVRLFKSSSVSLWQVYLRILNLPASIRAYTENIILCGLYTGPTKPDMKLLLEPIMERLNKLSSVGVTISVPDGDLIIRAKLVMGMFNFPVKASVLCSKQFNGEYGCCLPSSWRKAGEWN